MQHLFNIPEEKILVSAPIKFKKYDYVLPPTNIFSLNNAQVDFMGVYHHGKYLPQFSWWRTGNGACPTSSPNKVKILQGRSLYLCSTWGEYNICHNVLDGLSKMACYEAMGLDLSEIDFFLVNKLDDELDWFIGLMGLPKKKIRYVDCVQEYECEELIISEPPSHQGQYKSIIKNYFRKITSPVFNEPRKNTRMILLNRTTRTVLNSKELIEALPGWTPMFQPPSALDFYHSSAIISPNSSTLFKLMFCKKNTTLIEFLTSAHRPSYYYELTRVFDLQYKGLICDPVPSGTPPMTWNFNVDIEEFSDLLAELK